MSGNAVLAMIILILRTCVQSVEKKKKRNCITLCVVYHTISPVHIKSSAASVPKKYWNEIYGSISYLRHHG